MKTVEEQNHVNIDSKDDSDSQYKGKSEGRKVQISQFRIMQNGQTGINNFDKSMWILWYSSGESFLKDQEDGF